NSPEHDSTGLNHARRPSSYLSMISAQTPPAFVARENRYPLFRIMLYALTSAWANTTSIRVPECGPVLIWNRARLASTSALVSDRLTPELSEAWSDGAGVRNGSMAAATSLSLRPWPVSRTRSTTSPKSDSAVETMTWPPALARWIEVPNRLSVIWRSARASAVTCGSRG